MTTVGLCMPQLGPHVTRDALLAFCRRAEALGYASLWVQEHLFFPRAARSAYAGRPGVPVPDQYRSTLAPTETLALAAACTERVTIGTGVLVGGYHRPVELAQRLATLDVLSGGRLVAGLGAGWSDEEHEQMDVDPRTRGRRLDELLDALLACWGPDPVAFHGEFFSIPPSDVRPKPLQEPRPKLLSGMWSVAGLRRTAQHFDIWGPTGRAGDIVPVVAELNTSRPAGMAPLEVYQRVFVESPVASGSAAVAGVGHVVRAVERAVAAGFASVVVDASFWRAVDSPAAWAALPDVLLPALAAAGLSP